MSKLDKYGDRESRDAFRKQMDNKTAPSPADVTNTICLLFVHLARERRQIVMTELSLLHEALLLEET